MSTTRSLSNPPAYYYTLTTKQQRTWRQNTRKILRNEELRKQYPAFTSTTNIPIYHIDYKSTMDVIDELIIKAKHTQRYTIDTESEKCGKRNIGALIQIQFVQGWHDGSNTDPETERRNDENRLQLLLMYEEPDNDDDSEDINDIQYDPNQEQEQEDSDLTWSLQEAAATTLNKFLDKSMTVNLWQCGLDLQLNTWKTKLFSRK
ncbi:unnamed protein product [Rotaria sp. Silwood1]|nr:unnamed protein product [Rotaria sp. Silwood1]CAF3896588.1 unnamed protein product [Rotaria sp. Silwood1]CAF4949355.1 unnamed protein product [Rotaria sp. Silwood1]CAF4949577.1 unnamed protein product [Rotaria sp. Silwood1]CAF4980796.1 unnamed protein product [Rotaria sp. Silwood1]